MKIHLLFLLSACCCLSATMTIAAPIRSALGSDGTEFSEEEDWENPYITDGLVAMWDGFWNVGGGMHDARSKEWIDLVNGTAIPVAHARLSFERDALRFTSLGGIASFRNNVAPTFSCSHTIEVVCRVVEMPTAPGGNSYITAFNGQYALRIPRITTGGWLSLYYSNVGNVSIGLNAVGGGLAFHCAIVTDLGVGKVYDYADGEMISTLSGGFGITSSRLDIFDGLNGSGWAAGTVLEICCIRIYDRALIPGEVTFNYNLDKMRFNLP